MFPRPVSAEFTNPQNPRCQNCQKSDRRDFRQFWQHAESAFCESRRWQDFRPPFDRLRTNGNLRGRGWHYVADFPLISGWM